jgi:uracil-DNA glycosylase
MAAAVERDAHKMQAFVRFRRLAGPEPAREPGYRDNRPPDTPTGDWYVAWHRPDHHVLARVAPFFVDRFHGMRWSILTPDASAHWDGQALRLGPGVPARQAPGDDELDDLWRTYYAATFNPARINLRATRRELPVRHWPTLPEARLIAPLAAQARRRADSMTDPALTTSARAFFPAAADAPLSQLAEAARHCQGCPLYGPATQTVFGEGPPDARIMLVGEQPGNDEDLAGRPFVGPAGAVLDEALTAAGVDRRTIYLTNAVKHFKFEPRGRWRIHQRPRGREVQSCRPWLLAEIDRVRPDVLVALGATAASALFGPQVTPGRDRGRPVASALAPVCLVTYHPSAVLRANDPDAAARLRDALIADLQRARVGCAAKIGAFPSIL